RRARYVVSFSAALVRASCRARKPSSTSTVAYSSRSAPRPTPTRFAARVSMPGNSTAATANTAKAMISRRRTASCFAPRLTKSHATITTIPSTSSSWTMKVRLPTSVGPSPRISSCSPIGSALLRLLVGGGGAVAEDESGRALPVLGRGDVAAVDDQLRAGDVGGAQRGVLGMVGLHDHQVRGLAHVVRSPAEPGQLLVVVEGVVHRDLGAALAQRVHDGEHAGERGLLHPGPVGGAEHHGLQPLQAAEQVGGPLHEALGDRGVQRAGGADRRGGG